MLGYTNIINYIAGIRMYMTMTNKKKKKKCNE